MEALVAEKGPLDQPVTNYVWNDKYRYKDEASPSETFKRVATGVYAQDLDRLEEGLAALEARDWMPGGRIFAGAGTGKRVTWINCFVSPIIQDSMDTELEWPGVGIMDNLKVGALTQQQGGGIGMAYGTIRPSGALVARTHSVSSGVIPFMRMWDGMCGTIRSSGSRRGAMMATLPIWHPDVIEFIHCKTTKGSLENFNISVTVTDDFMEALKKKQDWDLGFHVPRADGNHVAVYEKDGKDWYVYKRLPAAELFDMITKNTYEYAEPGIIFIDQVNKLNNLYYIEDIQATNPCGEQPLPPNGDCDLGHVNLANMVLEPFTANARIDWDRLKKAVRTGVRFLDNVLDTSPFPTPEQREEALSKRRIGLGYTGLGTLKVQLMIRYGSKESIKLTEEVGKFIAVEAYWESVELAKERGTFPLYDRDKIQEAAFIKKLPKDLREAIYQFGLRNGVILTLAPTGTTSIFYGNPSSGVEPSFSWEYDRTVVVDQQGAEQIRETFPVEDYGWYLWRRTPEGAKWEKGQPLPDYMVTALELSVDEHLDVQAAAQKWIDAAISKTINCPADMPYDKFKEVYLNAYKKGCKGCTTYRPSGVRGSVLSTKDDPKTAEQPKHGPLKRPDVLEGETIKLKWKGQNYYLTISDYEDVDGSRIPFEIFLNTASPEMFEMSALMTRAVTAVCRLHADASFLFQEMEQVHSPEGGQIYRLPGEEKGSYTPSLTALIGRALRQHTNPVQPSAAISGGLKCSSCGEHAVLKISGCDTCSHCGQSKCG